MTALDSAARITNAYLSAGALAAAVAADDCGARLSDDLELVRTAARCHLEAGNIGSAIELYRRAETLTKASDRAKMDLAYAYLYAGKYHFGWSLHEARIPTRMAQAPFLPSKPRWDGMPTKHLLILPEGGFGDIIQFARYAREAAEICERVTIKCPRSLGRLLQGISPKLEIDAGPRDRFPPHSSWAFVMSLPYLLGIDSEAKIEGKPYLAVPAVAPPRGRPAVGLVWGGSPSHARDSQRSLPAEHVQRLLNVESVDWHILQQGPAANIIPSLVKGAHVHLHEGEINDFQDTAEIIAGLDAVVTVDTSVAHLAGALGVPTIVMLSAAPEFRWMHGREDSPWYDSVRLVRQTKAGEWGDVIERMIQELPSLGFLSPSTPADGNAHLMAEAGSV